MHDFEVDKDDFEEEQRRGRSRRRRSGRALFKSELLMKSVKLRLLLVSWHINIYHPNIGNDSISMEIEINR